MLFKMPSSVLTKASAFPDSLVIAFTARYSFSNVRSMLHFDVDVESKLSCYVHIKKILDRTRWLLRSSHPQDNCDFGNAAEGGKNQRLIADQWSSTFRGRSVPVRGQHSGGCTSAGGNIYHFAIPIIESLLLSLSHTHAFRLPKPIPTISDYLITRKRAYFLLLGSLSPSTNLIVSYLSSL